MFKIIPGPNNYDILNTFQKSGSKYTFMRKYNDTKQKDICSPGPCAYSPALLKKILGNKFKKASKHFSSLENESRIGSCKYYPNYKTIGSNSPRIMFS